VIDDPEKPGDKLCEFGVAHVIEFDPKINGRIRWELRSIDPETGRRFVFRHTDNKQEGGIRFGDKSVGEPNFENDLALDIGGAKLPKRFFGKKLVAKDLGDATLFLYTIHASYVEDQRDEDDESKWKSCGDKPPGPAIINRGR
jgi:hypothetical protein